MATVHRGGISTPASFGQLILLSQLRYGFKGKLYPISRRGGETAGLKIYERLSQTEARQISSSLRKMKPDPYLEINPETGSNLGIKDGEWVALERPKFKRQIRFRARFTPDMPPYVVSSVFGWWFPEKPAPEYGCLESNINAIVSYDPPYDPIEGTYQVRGILCRINKL